MITGAAGGLGRALALSFAAAQDVVLLVDRDKTAMSGLRDQITAGGGRAEIMVADLGTRAACRALAGRCGEVDVLINNAALTQMSYAGVIVRDDDYWDRTFAVDFFAPITLMQELVPGMSRRKSGVVINISSVSAARGTPDLAPYACAKAALETLTKVAAMELAMRGTGVRVNCVAPGLVDTPALARNFPDRATQENVARAMVPIGRTIDPAEIARVCLFLASDAASAVVGAVVNVDGGMNAGAFSFSASGNFSANAESGII